MRPDWERIVSDGVDGSGGKRAYISVSYLFL